jgi:hypothetical protein
MTMRTYTLTLALLFMAASLPAQFVTFKNGDRWEVNNPFKLDEKTRPPRPIIDPSKASFDNTFEKLERKTITGGIEMSTTKKISEAILIEWPIIQPMVDAKNLILRGESSKALETIEPVLKTFSNAKTVRGSPWIKAAAIKLDALDRLDNEAAMSTFLETLDKVDDGSSPELTNKIKLAKLLLQARKGDHAGVIAAATALIPQMDDPDVLARLHLLKGESLLALKKYEDAMNTYLRVPVFYGSQQEHLPKALLGAAKAFRGMDSPATRSQKLEEVSNRYLSELIATFPVSKEAEEAKKLLPKEDRAAAEAAQGSIQQTPPVGQ